MEADYHALSLIALPVLTVLACFTFYRGAPSGRRIILGLAAAGAAWALQPAYAHPCGGGQPLTQWLLPVLCIAPAVMFIHSRLVATTAAVVLLAMAPVFSNFYLDFVHRDGYTGNPDRAAGIAFAGSPSRLKEMEDALKRLSAGDARDHPAGWLRSSEIWSLLSEEDRLGD